MARRSIYVNDALDAEMNQFEELNWSQIAAEAFATAIRTERLKMVDIVESKLERLRASRAGASDQQRANGEAAGKRWALDVAEYGELERVASIDASEILGEEGDLVTAVCAAIEGEDFVARDVVDVLERLGFDDPKYATDAWFEGFCEGANKIFDAV